MQRTRRRGGAKFKIGMTTAKQLRNTIQLAKRKRQAQHIAHSIKQKQSKMVNELSNLFSAASFKPKFSPKSHKKSKSSGITKKSHATKVESHSNNLVNLFSSMKMGPIPRAASRVSKRDTLIANQYAREVKERKKRTAALRSMTPLERTAARLQSAMHVNKPKKSNRK